MTVQEARNARIATDEKRAKRLAYYARNRERMLADSAAYRVLNKERVAANGKKYYQLKKAELYEKKRAYMAANPEKVRRWKRADYERHRDAYIRRAAKREVEKKSEIQIWRRRYYQANKERIDARNREYQQRHGKQIVRYQRLYRLSVKGRAGKKASDRRCAARAAAYKAEWARRNRKKLNQRFCVYLRVRSSRDPAFAMRLRLRARFVAAIRRHLDGTLRSRTAAAYRLLGCELSELVRHLESKFLPGMSWENRSQWHVDHIKPLCTFDLTKPEQQAVAFHYTNLQPLWAIDNLRKGGRWQRLS